MAAPLSPEKAASGPIIHDANAVRVLGEAPNTIWWQGRTWAVTIHGIERRDGRYVIEAERLAERWGWDKRLPAWPLHIATKMSDPADPEWDLPDFRTAWLVACLLHGARITPKDAMVLA